MSIIDRNVQILTDRGYTEVLPQKSRKYRQFGKDGDSGYYWLGKNGAVRRGKVSSQSFSITNLFKRG